MKSYRDYVHFQTEDFLSDPPFREWAAHPTPEMNAYWQGLLQTHPHLDESFSHARHVALGLESSWTAFSDTYVNALYSRIQSVATDADPAVNWGRWQTYRLAAAVATILLAGIWGWRYYFTAQTFSTQYGELREVRLYDGSLVTLNANSSLQLPSRYEWRSTREVWLNGEAYFNVRKQAMVDNNSFRKFTVHTHPIDVMVVGTRFNVYTRPQKTQILLDEGRVQLSGRDNRQLVTMQPGQLIEYGATQHHSVVRRAIPRQLRQVVSWKKNLLAFDEAEMSELARRFNETYGLALVLEGDDFENQQFTGELPINDLDKALLILSQTFDMKPIRDGERVYFITTN